MRNYNRYDRREDSLVEKIILSVIILSLFYIIAGMHVWVHFLSGESYSDELGALYRPAFEFLVYVRNNF